MRKIAVLVALALSSAASRAQSSGMTNIVGTANDAAYPTRQLSLSDAIAMALESNLDIQVLRFNPTISRYSLAEANAVYEPALNTRYSHFDQSSSGGLSAGLPLPPNVQRGDGLDTSVGQGVSGYTPVGMHYELGVGFNNTERIVPGNVTGEFFTVSPYIRLSQPLLRNSWIDANRANIQLARRDVHISEDQLRQQINDTLLETEVAYHNLIYARENVKVQATALELASQLLRENRKKVEVGALAPLDEKQAESEVASTRAALINAEGELGTQMNKLKSLITDKFADWRMVNIEPSEALVAVPTSLDLPSSWSKGLTQRPDLSRLKFALEKAGITVKFRKNQLWPQLDVFGSYGLTELRSTGYNETVNALSDMRNPSYTVGFNLSVPLGNRSARAQYSSAKAAKEQALTQYRRLEQIIMVDIDDAVKAVRTSFEGIQATRAARVFAEEALAAEQKKLENGKSTSFLVLQAQRDLTKRRSDEIKSLADYNNALATLSHHEGATMERHHIQMK